MNHQLPVTNPPIPGASTWTGFPASGLPALASAGRTGLAGLPGHEALDQVARIASMVLDTPFAAVAIADDPRFPHGAWVGAGTVADRHDLAEQSLHQYVIESDERLIIEDVRHDVPVAARRPLGSARVIAWAGIPVRHPDGHVVGALCVADHRPRRWNSHDVEVLEALANVASSQVALRIAVEHEAEPAGSVQDPAEARLPAISGLQIAARCLPGPARSEVVGAFYDVVPSVGGRWGLVVGDICGTGAPTARNIALVRHVLRADAYREARPSTILAGLNQALLGWPAVDRRLVTAACAVVRPGLAGTVVQISSAGRPQALVRRPDGTVLAFGRPGTLLGLRADPDLCETRRVLRAGDSLILVSDGVIEARSYMDRGRFGDDRLRDVVTGLGNGSAAQLAEGILQAARAFSGGRIGDDTVALVLRVPGARAGSGTHAAAWPGTSGYPTMDARAAARRRHQPRRKSLPNFPGVPPPAAWPGAPFRESARNAEIARTARTSGTARTGWIRCWPANRPRAWTRTRRPSRSRGLTRPSRSTGLTRPSRSTGLTRLNRSTESTRSTRCSEWNRNRSASPAGHSSP